MVRKTNNGELPEAQGPAPSYFVEKVDGMDFLQTIQFSLLLFFGITLTVLFGAWWFEPSHISHNWGGPFHILDIFLFGILSYIVWHQVVMELFCWYLAAHVKVPESPPPPRKGLRVAYLTAFVPGAEPYDVLENSLKAMVAVSYPHDTWLLDEGNDATARRICAQLGVKHYSRKDQEKFNTEGGKFKRKTKGGNYNSWLHQFEKKYDIVAQHDMDFIPTENFLSNTLGYFEDPTVAFVGLPQIYGNAEESWIARGAAEQTYGFYGPMQKGFFSHDMTLLIGANHIMRVAAYRDIDGYTAHIAEDMLTGMKLYAHESNWHSVYVPEVLLVGEGPSTWTSYFAQQMRWAYGCMDIVFRHAPSLLSQMSPRRIFNYVLLQQFYFAGVAQVAGIVLLVAYFVFGVTSANMQTLPIFLLYVPLVIYQILFQFWLQRLNVDPEAEGGLLLRGRILSLAVWPVFFLAFVGVLRGKRLTYVVTPKGDSQTVERVPGLFVPHLILGSITLAGVILGLFFHHFAAQIVFWALLNTIIMYSFFFTEAIPFWMAEFRSRELRKAHRIVPSH